MRGQVPSAPQARTHFAILLFGASAAPLFWLGQLVLSYGVTAFLCYPGDHPAPANAGGAMRAALILFDIVAILAALAGGVVSAWCLAQRDQQGHAVMPHIREGRSRFLALWGVMFSLWFLCAILFNVIASVMVPLCTT